MLPLRRLLFVAILSAGTVAALGWARPAPSGGPLAWSGTETATVAAWALAVAAATWLTLFSTVCLVALRRGHSAFAAAAARRAPRVVRRAVEGALAASLIVGTAAGAATVDQPVVRSPRAASLPSPTTTPVRDTPSTTAPPPTTTTTPHASADASPHPDQPIVRAPQPRPAAPRPSRAPATPAAPVETRPRTRPSTTHLVVAGDNLWLIARNELIARGNAHPDDGAVATYWRSVIDANQSTLRSGNPSLIFPGEIVALPEPV